MGGRGKLCSISLWKPRFAGTFLIQACILQYLFSLPSSEPEMKAGRPVKGGEEACCRRRRRVHTTPTRSRTYVPAIDLFEPFPERSGEEEKKNEICPGY